MGITTNNMAKLGAMRQGLMLSWELGFKFIHVEIDSITVLSWLTAKISNFPSNVFPLLCDCRSLMEWAWEVQVRHIYRESNECAKALAKRENHQQHLLTIYDTCPNFVYQCFVKDMAGQWISRLCPLRQDIAMIYKLLL